MRILILLIPLSLLVLSGAVAAFFWAVDHGQFEDLETPGLLPLDDTPAPPTPLQSSGEHQPDKSHT